MSCQRRAWQSLIAARITRHAPSPFSAGCDVIRVADMPYSTTSRGLAPLRFCACSSDSRSEFPLPAPTTHPRGQASTGAARAGSSCGVERGCHGRIRPRPSEFRPLRYTPQIIISSAPRSMILKIANCIAEAEHAVAWRNSARARP